MISSWDRGLPRSCELAWSVDHIGRQPATLDTPRKHLGWVPLPETFPGQPRHTHRRQSSVVWNDSRGQAAEAIAGWAAASPVSWHPPPQPIMPARRPLCARTGLQARRSESAGVARSSPPLWLLGPAGVPTGTTEMHLKLHSRHPTLPNSRCRKGAWRKRKCRWERRRG